MRKQLEEMLNWSYKEAYAFFTENAYGRVIPESKEYVTSLNSSSTIDLRKNSNARELILNSINHRTFILVDGGSLNGKSTIANRIAKHVNGIVLDIDLLCKDWLEEQLKSAKTPIECFFIIQNYNKLTDDFLLNELENIVCQKSALERPIFLVGQYLEVIYRSVIARTLGKYFERTVSLLCCENSFKIVEQHIAKRNKEFSTNLSDIRQMCLEKYKTALLLIRDYRCFLGMGMDTSFIVNCDVSNMFK